MDRPFARVSTAERDVAADSAMSCAVGGRRAGARRPHGRTLLDALQQNAKRYAAKQAAISAAVNASIVCTSKEEVAQHPYSGERSAELPP